MSRKYTLQEIAKNLQVSYVTIWREVRDGKLIAVTVRGSLRVTEADYEAYLAKQRLTPVPARHL